MFPRYTGCRPPFGGFSDTANHLVDMRGHAKAKMALNKYTACCPDIRTDLVMISHSPRQTPLLASSKIPIFQRIIVP
jgi:hypothetical protein